MEFWIAFGITFVIGMLYKAGKKQKNKTKSTQSAHVDKPKANNSHAGKLTQADEELITVILPTIKNE